MIGVVISDHASGGDIILIVILENECRLESDFDSEKHVAFVAPPPLEANRSSALSRTAYFGLAAFCNISAALKCLRIRQTAFSIYTASAFSRNRVNTRYKFHKRE
jgi:hypothetical protein